MRFHCKKIGPLTVLLLLLMFHVGTFRPGLAAVTQSKQAAFQGLIIDKRYALSRNFKRIPRKKTEYIIIHTSEAGLRSTLNSVSQGKCLASGRRTCGGHTHYAIARDGQTYHVLDKEYVADHAGLSMWNGKTDLSDVSIAIELVGYHYTEITEKQYQSVRVLIDILKAAYGLNDAAVLTHSQVAYGRPNRWLNECHRGRKKCAQNFDRIKAGLGPTAPYDPDVQAGRLRLDETLAAIFYRSMSVRPAPMGWNLITASNTAWAIAGEDYDAPTTLYRLPSGKEIRGDEIDRKVGWNRIPEKTIVLLNQEESPQAGAHKGPVKTISDGLTAWTLAGAAYKHHTTHYFFPNGHLKNGRQVSDWDDLPSDTRIIIGYESPRTVTSKKTVLQIAGEHYKQSDTLYYFPDRTLVPGDRIEDFTRLPRGVKIFVPVNASS